jgi:hypothetical protein
MNICRHFHFLRVAFVGFLILLINLVGSLPAAAQLSDPISPIPDYVRRAAENREKNNPTFNELMRKVGLGMSRPVSGRGSGMSAEDRKRIKALMTPNPEDVAKYREFLKQDDTGIFRLYSDYDCTSKGLISVADGCANQVHNGSQHSFRGSNYFFDIKYNHGNLVGIGFFSHDILADLGDVSLEELTVDSRGVNYLNSLAPANAFKAAGEQFRKIAVGFESDGVRFSRSVVPQLDHTYAMRIIAFDNKDPLWSRMTGRNPDPLVWKFKSVQSDRRTDVIVAFRIVRLEQDGNVTLLWKRLSSKKAPVISFGKKEPLRGFDQ